MASSTRRTVRMQDSAAGFRSGPGWPVAFSRATAWLRFTPAR